MEPLLGKSEPEPLPTRIQAFIMDMYRYRTKPSVVSAAPLVACWVSRRRWMPKAGIFLIIVALIANMVGCSLPPIQIEDWYDFDAIRNNLGGRYRLMNNLDSTTPGYAVVAGYMANGRRGWQPIGTSANPFTGSFDAQRYVIQDLFIDRRDQDEVGLFGFVGDAGVIKNVELVNAVVMGREYVGGVAGTNNGALINCGFSGRITGQAYFGALVGANTGTVTNSYYNHNDVLINGERMITIGALPREDFVRWLANGKFLDVNQRLLQENGYYLVNNISDFRALLAFGQDSSLRFRLNNDLNLANEADFYIPYLAGEFDGDGHTIINFTFHSGSISQVGLFGYLAFGARVTQLRVENVNVNGVYLVGGLVGRSNGAVTNCYASGNVGGDQYVGGLIGYNAKGVVNNVRSAGTTSGKWDIGGLVGVNEGTVTNSYSTSMVKGWYSVGGVAGTNVGAVTNCYSNGSVTAWESVGGLVGVNKGSLSNSYSTGNVNGWYSVGGLTGTSWGTVSNSYALGIVTGRSVVGGLVGSSHGPVRDCYVKGDVVGETHVGGLVGRNYGTVRNSYVRENVTGEWNVGGVIGDNYGAVKDCYFRGNITGKYCVGGLIGQHDGTASNCHSIGSVNGNQYVGGLTGSNSGTVTTSYSTSSVTGSSVVSGFVAINNRDGTVSESYSTGNVAGDYYVGGLVGVNFGSVNRTYSSASVSGYENVGGLVAVNLGGMVSNSFWDVQASGQRGSAGGTAKNTTEMRSITTFLQAGWNIRAVMPSTTSTAFTWNIVDGQTYPFLSWQSAS